jgi:outer membrane protein insertion porin family
LNSGIHGWENIVIPPWQGPTQIEPNVPDAILAETGYHLLSRIGASLAYDTRNSVKLPNHGQRTEVSAEVVNGDRTFYKSELTTAWYFPGLFRGHVLEIGGRAGVAQSLGSGDVPFYERYYLGGLYSLRGFKYRSIAPRDPSYGTTNPLMPNEPIGGDSYWFGSAEYSVPIVEKEDGVAIRFAVFYDAGDVGASSYSFSGNFDDNWGLGLRLTIPHLGPLRFDYGVPIHHDKYNGPGGQFQFGAGYYREF